MKKAVVGILNRVPVVLIVIGEALVIYGLSLFGVGGSVRW